MGYNRALITQHHPSSTPGPSHSAAATTALLPIAKLLLRSPGARSYKHSLCMASQLCQAPYTCHHSKTLKSDMRTQISKAVSVWWMLAVIQFIIKLKIYSTVILPAVLYVCET
jgi:hypothetical protein